VTAARSRRPTASLFVQLLTATLVTLAIAQIISMMLVFNLPPPNADFYRLTEITQALHGRYLPPPDRRPLETIVSDKPPGPRLETQASPVIRKLLADSMGTVPEKVVIASDRGPLSDRRVFEVVRDQLAREGVRDEHFLVAPFQVGVQRPDGRWIVVEPKPALALTDWQQRVAITFLVLALGMTPVAYLFARRASAPIRLFADAAERLGRDPGAPALSLKGSAEIDVAVQAINEMQQRIRSYVDDQTAMVAAIAHDLRTPLTRMRFRIESLPEDQRAKMAADMDQMETMITAALTFARDATQPAERRRLELSSLLESLCDEMSETGADTEMLSREKVVLEGDPMALRRLFANLLDNAVKFGGHARARVFRQDQNAVVEIDDDGPGIPPADRERVFEPFYRREPSRSRVTGGTGLGLAIVRSIARGHGGDVALLNRRGGGLTARVLLPL
jgi:signal transduction histidine kinase